MASIKPAVLDEVSVADTARMIKWQRLYKFRKRLRFMLQENLTDRFWFIPHVQLPWTYYRDKYGLQDKVKWPGYLTIAPPQKPDHSLEVQLEVLQSIGAI